MQKLELRITLWEPANSETDLQLRERKCLKDSRILGEPAALVHTGEKTVQECAADNVWQMCALAAVQCQGFEGLLWREREPFHHLPRSMCFVFFPSGSRISAGILETQPHAVIILPRRKGTHSHWWGSVISQSMGPITRILTALSDRSSELFRNT